MLRRPAFLVLLGVGVVVLLGGLGAAGHVVVDRFTADDRPESLTRVSVFFCAASSSSLGHDEAMSYRVTFVCTGNICRSPMAASVLRHHVEQEGLDVEVDSSGTGPWHAGEGADYRAVAALRRAGYPTAHVARQFQADWFPRYDLIVALDTGHLRTLQAMAPDAEARGKIRLLREFDPDAGPDLDVPDPYGGRPEDFDVVLRLVEAAMPGLLDEIRAALKEQN